MQKTECSYQGLVSKFLFLSAMTLASAGFAQTLPQNVVISDDLTVETPLTDEVGDVFRGLETFIDRKAGNCVACHVNFDVQAMEFLGNVGPNLNWVGDYYTPGELRAILVNSSAVFGDDTIMPSFYVVESRNRVLEGFQGKPILTAQQVEDLVAYMSSLANARAFEGAD